MAEDPTDLTFVLHFACTEATSGAMIDARGSYKLNFTFDSTGNEATSCTMIDARGSYTFNVCVVFCRR